MSRLDILTRAAAALVHETYREERLEDGDCNRLRALGADANQAVIRVRRAIAVARGTLEAIRYGAEPEASEMAARGLEEFDRLLEAAERFGRHRA